MVLDSWMKWTGGGRAALLRVQDHRLEGCEQECGGALSRVAYARAQRAQIADPLGCALGIDARPECAGTEGGELHLRDRIEPGE